MIIWQFFVSWEVFARWQCQLSTSSENQKEKEVFFNRAKTMFQFLQPRILTWIVIALKTNSELFFCHGDNFGLDILNPVTNAVNVLQARIYKSVKQAHF